MSRIDELIEELCPEGVPVRQLGDVAEVQRGRSISRAEVTEGPVPVLAGGQQPSCWHIEGNRDGENVVVAGSGAYAGFVSYWAGPIWVSDSFSIAGKPNLLLTKFCFYFLKNRQADLHQMKRGSGVPHVYAKDVAHLPLPVPPLRVQREIVSILDKFTQLETDLEAELEARRIQYEVTRDRLLDFSGDLEGHPFGSLMNARGSGLVPSLPVSEIATIKIGEFVKKTRQDPNAPYPVFNGGVTETGFFENYNSPENSIVISARGSIGFVNFLRSKFWAGNSCYVIRPNGDSVQSRYLYHFLKAKEGDLYALRAVGGIPALNLAPVRDFHVPVPSIEVQTEIVSTLDKLDALVNDITVGLPAEIAARRKQYEYYRNKLLTFKELDAA